MALEQEARIPAGAPSGDRRARRRQETITEILDIALDVMTEEGVNGLSLAEVARRLGVQPPSIYKYFASIMAVYDALFLRGQVEHLEVLRAGMANGESGLDALTKGLEASGRWLLENRALAQLLFWRPVPNFTPSPEAFAPSQEMVRIQREALASAVAAGQLGPAADRAHSPRPWPTSRNSLGAQGGSRPSSRGSWDIWRTSTLQIEPLPLLFVALGVFGPAVGPAGEPWRRARVHRVRARPRPSAESGLVKVTVRLFDFDLAVHDKGPAHGHRLTDRPSLEDEGLGAICTGGHHDRLVRPE
jgi:AcrR family transcriptional regulator